VASLFLLDGVARPAVRNFFGPGSVQFFHFYWTTDVVFALGAFLVICGFFRRACREEEKLWRLVRPMLIFVFVTVLALSALSLAHQDPHRSGKFIVEFSQNLYFTCLVLNTLLYIMLQQLAIEDDELGLLVCGMGVQFAGEAAYFAFCYLTLDYNFVKATTFLAPCCTLAMLAIWVYAIGKTPKTVSARLQPGENESLVRVVAD
jgi:fucose 4-O-acetylase-like acetyltransferase